MTRIRNNSRIREECADGLHGLWVRVDGKNDGIAVLARVSHLC